MTAAPRLSVVLCATGGTSFNETLLALSAQADAVDLERLLVARRGDPAVTGLHADRWRVAWVAPELTLGQMFLDALRAASGTVVAMTTDHFIPAADWIARVRDAHQGAEGPSVVAGAIGVDDRAPLVTRAVYACEYSPMGPAGATTTDAAPAANLSLSRSAVDILLSQAGAQGWDADWSRCLRDAGVTVTRDPSRLVRLAHRYTVLSFGGERFHFSRVLSGHRAGGWGAWRRVSVAALMLGLPLRLAGRLIVSLWRVRPSVAVIRAVPVSLLFTIPWTLGDIVGVLAGPGDSARKVG